MISRPASFLMLFTVSALAFGQRAPQAPPPTNMVAPNIPGVVAAGTPIQVVKYGFDRAEGPVAMSDGGILFTGRNSITRIDPGGNASTFAQPLTGRSYQKTYFSANWRMRWSPADSPLVPLMSL